MSLKDFLKQCHSRGVFKTLSLYIVSSWVILQVLSVIAEPLGFPEKSITYLIILLLIGLPIYMFYLWKTRVRYAKSSSNEDLELMISDEVNFKKMYFVSLTIIALLSIMSVVLIINNNFSSQLILPTLKESNKIAVLDFDNNTGDTKLDAIGKISADWLINGITLHDAGEVVSSEIIDDYSHVLGVQSSSATNKNILDKFFQPSKIINGAYFINDDSLVFNCSIIDGSNRNILVAFPLVQCSKTNPLDCIESLREEVLGYLITNEEQINLENKPPKFNAYEKLLDAQANFADSQTYLRLLNEAIAIDSNFFEPKIHRIQHFYNERDYAKADSLIGQLNFGQRLTKNQQYFLNYLNALIQGKNNNCYRYHEFDYKNAPFNLITNSTQMILALNYINRPDLVEEVFDKIEMDEMLLDNCSFCLYRYYTMASAFNQLGQFDEAIQLLDPVTSMTDVEELNEQLLTAYVRSDQIDNIDRFINNYKITAESASINNLLLFTGRELLMKGQQEKADELFQAIIANPESSTMNLAKAHYYKGNFSEAARHYENVHKAGNKTAITISRLSVCYNKLNDQAKEASTIAQIESFREAYDYGIVDYCYAQYYMATDSQDQALEYLLKSIALGNKYADNTYQNDSHFASVLSTPKFQEILTYWH